MERADEADEKSGECERTSCHARRGVPVSIAPARRFVLCKRRGKSQRLEAVALRVAVRSVTMHSAVRRVLRDSLSMEVWENSEVRQAGRPAARLCPGHGTPLPRRRGSGVSDTAAAGLSECGHFPAPKDHREITGGSQGSDRADGQGLCRFGVEQQDMVAGQLK